MLLVCSKWFEPWTTFQSQVAKRKIGLNIYRVYAEHSPFSQASAKRGYGYVSKLEQSSATSSTWMTSSSVPDMSKKSTHLHTVCGTPKPRGWNGPETSVLSIGWRSHSQSERPPPRVVENNKAKTLWDFQIQNDKQVMVNQQEGVEKDVVKTGTCRARVKLKACHGISCGHRSFKDVLHPLS